MPKAMPNGQVFHARPWEPLEVLAKAHQRIKPDDFMFMGAYPVAPNGVIQDGPTEVSNFVLLYKNRDTRNYINLDETGKTYAYKGGATVAVYTEIPVEEAITHALS